jgi:hypothetical protein
LTGAALTLTVVSFPHLLQLAPASVLFSLGRIEAFVSLELEAQPINSVAAPT